MNVPKVITQGNEITFAKGNWTELEKNIFYSLLGELKKDDAPDKMYYVDINDINSKSGTVNRVNDYRVACDRIISRVFHFKMLREYPNGKLEKSTLITALVHTAEIKENSSVIELQVGSKVRPLLFGLKDNFTMLELDLAISLKSKYSKRIYEILSSFRNVGSYHTTVEELKLTLGLIDPKTGVEQLTVWTKFENDVLKKAMLEINKKTELNMSYTLRKWGRKYHWIDFKFKVVPLQKTIQYETPVNEMTTALMNELNLAPYQVSQILESFDQKQIWKKIMEIRMAKNDGKIKSSVGAYSAYAFGLIKPKNYEQK